MLSQALKEEKQEAIVGFHILSDGSFLKIHKKPYVEIRKGDVTTFIKIEEVDPRWTKSTKIIELPDQHLVLAYCRGWTEDCMVILDLNNGKCMASKAIDEVESLSALENGRFLINSKIICFYQGNDLVTEKAKDFIDFSKRALGIGYYRLSTRGPRYFLLPDKSGFIYFDDNRPSTIKMITHQFKERDQKRLCSVDNWPWVMDFAFLSYDKFACITADRLDRHYELHVVNTDLTRSYKTNLHRFVKLLMLNDYHLAVVGSSSQLRSQDYHYKTCVKVFNVSYKKVTEVKKITIDIPLEDVFVAATPYGELVTCTKTGDITIHHVFSMQKFKEKTESVLASRLPKDLISIVTGYAGFFGRCFGAPKDKFAEIDYRDDGFFSKLRAKF